MRIDFNIWHIPSSQERHKVKNNNQIKFSQFWSIIDKSETFVTAENLELTLVHLKLCVLYTPSINCNFDRKMAYKQPFTPCFPKQNLKWIKKRFLFFSWYLKFVKLCDDPVTLVTYIYGCVFSIKVPSWNTRLVGFMVLRKLWVTWYIYPTVFCPFTLVIILMWRHIWYLRRNVCITVPADKARNNLVFVRLIITTIIATVF